MKVSKILNTSAAWQWTKFFPLLLLSFYFPQGKHMNFSDRKFFISFFCVRILTRKMFGIQLVWIFKHMSSVHLRRKCVIWSLYVLWQSHIWWSHLIKHPLKGSERNLLRCSKCCQNVRLIGQKRILPGWEGIYRLGGILGIEYTDVAKTFDVVCISGVCHCM